MRNLPPPTRRPARRAQRRHRSWIRFAAALVLLNASGVTGVAGEEISQSRYRLTVASLNANPVLDDVDEAVVVAFCQDADGCEVTLRLETAASTSANFDRLFVSESSTRWVTFRQQPSFQLDGDLNADPVLAVSDGGPHVCLFGDFDSTGNDSGPGFAMHAVNATCVLTLID